YPRATLPSRGFPPSVSTACPAGAAGLEAKTGRARCERDTGRASRNSEAFYFKESSMSATNGKPIPAVADRRMSSGRQDKAIPQQQAEMLPRCKLEGIEVVAEFKDEAISGGGMKRRDAYLDMLRFCEDQHKQGERIDAVVCYDTSRFSRADSNETSAYIWRF